MIKMMAMVKILDIKINKNNIYFKIKFVKIFATEL